MKPVEQMLRRAIELANNGSEKYAVAALATACRDVEGSVEDRETALMLLPTWPQVMSVARELEAAADDARGKGL